MIEKIYDIFQQSTGISTDTRKIEPGSLFVALKGDNFNGNKFAIQAIESGAGYALVDEVENEHPQLIVVDDVLTTLQDLARHHRQTFDIPVLGITGTNGKTTSKELIYTVLETQYNVHYTKGNLNNHIGVPLTLLEMKENTEIAVIEMGANHVGEIKTLCDIALPTHGIITNIGKAHLEGFGSVENIIKTKSELYDSLRPAQGYCFVNDKDDILTNASNGLPQHLYNTGECELTSPFPLEVTWNNTKIETQLFGDYNYLNVQAAICIGSFFDVTPQNIAKSISAYAPSNNRSQIIKTDENTVIMDAYNANPVSMSLAITSFLKLKTNKVLVLGDMLELGEFSLSEHQAIADLIEKEDVTALLVGAEFNKTNTRHTTLANYEEAGKRLSELSLSSASVLIKGSRGIKLEKTLPFIP